jgi:hypothetical protein
MISGALGISPPGTVPVRVNAKEQVDSECTRSREALTAMDMR